MNTEIKLELSGVNTTGPPGQLVTMEEVSCALNTDASNIMASIDQQPAELQAIASKIDPLSHAAIARYGEKLQRRFAASADQMLNAVMAQNLVEVDLLITDMVTTIEAFDDAFDDKFSDKITRFFGADKPPSPQRLASLQEKCLTAFTLLEGMEKRLTGKQLRLDTEMRMFDDLYRQNLEYYKNFSQHIMVGEQGLAKIRSGDLAEYLPDDTSMTTVFSEHNRTAWCDSFSERLQSLKVSRTICLQAAAEIRLVQKSFEQIIQRIQDSVYNMLTLWKRQVATTLAIEGARTITTTQADLVSAVRRDNAKFIASLKDFLSAEQTSRTYQDAAATELSRLTGILSQYS